MRHLYTGPLLRGLLFQNLGPAGMEACIANLVEPGDTVVVGNNGIWGARVVDMAGRFGGKLASAGVHTGCCHTYTLPDVMSSSLTSTAPWPACLPGHSIMHDTGLLQILLRSPDAARGSGVYNPAPARVASEDV